MFDNIIPDDLTDDNRHRASLLAAGLNGGALPTEQAAVALMLRLPYGVGLRDDVWKRYVVTEDDGTDTGRVRALYSWTDLAEAAESGNLPLSRGERYLVRAACAIASPMLGAPLHQVVTGVDRPNFDLLIAALHHAAGRPNPADQLADRETELAEARRLLDAQAVAEAALADRLAAMRDQLAAVVEPVRGTEDGTGEPVPDGVEGHHAGHHWPGYDPADFDGPEDANRAWVEQMQREAEHVDTHAATGGDCCEDPQPAEQPIGGAR